MASRRFCARRAASGELRELWPEAPVWLTDIAGLSREEAADLMRWSASSLLQAALANHPAADSSAT